MTAKTNENRFFMSIFAEGKTVLIAAYSTLDTSDKRVISFYHFLKRNRLPKLDT